MNNYAKESRHITISTLDKLDDVSKRIAHLEKERENWYKPAFEEKMRLLTDERAEVISRGQKALSDATEAYKQEVKRMYTPDGEQITPDAALLSSGLALNQEDLERLFDKHNGNHTMQRLIHEYAFKNDMPLNRVFRSEADHMAATDIVQKYFNSAMSYSEYGDIWRNERQFNKAMPKVLIEQ